MKLVCFFLIENAENIDKSELYRISKNILSKRFKLFKIESLYHYNITYLLQCFIIIIEQIHIRD